MEIIVRKIATYLKALLYPYLLPSQMKIVTKILNLERKETKVTIVTISKKERKVITSSNEKTI